MSPTSKAQTFEKSLKQITDLSCTCNIDIFFCLKVEAYMFADTILFIMIIVVLKVECRSMLMRMTVF